MSKPIFWLATGTNRSMISVVTQVFSDRCRTHCKIPSAVAHRDSAISYSDGSWIVSKPSSTVTRLCRLVKSARYSSLLNASLMSSPFHAVGCPDSCNADRGPDCQLSGMVQPGQPIVHQSCRGVPLASIRDQPSPLVRNPVVSYHLT